MFLSNASVVTLVTHLQESRLRPLASRVGPSSPPPKPESLRGPRVKSLDTSHPSSVRVAESCSVPDYRDSIVDPVASIKVTCDTATWPQLLWPAS